MSSPHTIQEELSRAGAFTTNAGLFRTPEGIVFGAGKTVGNGIDGWAPGAIFLDTDSGTISRNTNTKASASWSVLKLVGGQAITDTGGYYSTDTLDGATDEIGAHVIASTPKRRFNCALTAFRNTSGAAFGVGSAGATTGFLPIDTNDVVLAFHGGGATAAFLTFTLPKDLDSASDILVHYIGGVDTVSADRDMVVQAYFANVGTASAVDKVTAGATAVFSNLWSDASVLKTVTIAAAGVLDPSSSPVSCTLEFTPESEADELYIGAVWIEYTGQLKT